MVEELKVEFAVIDYLMVEPVNLRAGILLLTCRQIQPVCTTPLSGTLTERPWSTEESSRPPCINPVSDSMEPFIPPALSQVNYELYLTSGFTNAFGGEDNPNQGIPPTSPSPMAFVALVVMTQSFDNNEGKGWVGRLAFSPFLGAEVGTSGFVGTYDPVSDRNIGLFAVDWTLQRGPWELIGESAWAWIAENNLHARWNSANCE